MKDVLLAVEIVRLPWYVVLLHVVPLLVLVWASWVIWRIGRRRDPSRRKPARPATWDLDTCRRCGEMAEIHEKTRLCATCHHLPLPDKREVPDYLPDRL